MFHRDRTARQCPLPQQQFKYWKGSEYRPGDKYKVTENHTFTAQWEEITDIDITPQGGEDPTAPTGGGSSTSVPDKEGSGSSGSGTRTGDSANVVLWLMLFITAFTGILVFAVRRQITLREICCKMLER